MSSPAASKAGAFLLAGGPGGSLIQPEMFLVFGPGFVLREGKISR